MSIYAKVIACSESSLTGVRVTTLEVCFPRIILPQVLTHCAFTRSSASSRAIPTKKRIEAVRNTPYIPFHFGRNQPGMQAGEEVEALDEARVAWLGASIEAATHAQWLLNIGIHKQHANRVLEPYLWHEMVITSTDWYNWMACRLHEDAQPEIQALAKAMSETLDRAYPEPMARGEWHLPYIGDEWTRYGIDEQVKISAARCARVSYKPFDADKADAQADIQLYDKLTASTPIHANPLAHVCTPATPEERPQGNLRSWHQLRHLVELDRALNLKALLA